MMGIKIKNAIVCEHIVEGKNNKHTLVNTMAGDILAESFPANMSIAFYIELTSTQDIVETVNIKIILGKMQVAGGDAEIPFKKDESAVLALPAGLLNVDAPTKLKVIIQCGDAKPVTAVAKTFRQGPLSTTA
jgi:hypothetical protein